VQELLMTPLLRRSRPGQTLVEFALILPVFLLLLLGIMDLGRAVYDSSTLSNSAREGARLGITDQMCRDIWVRAKDHAVGIAADTTVAIEVRDPAGALVGTCPAIPTATDFVLSHYGDVVHVTVTYTYQAATPVIGRIVGTISLKGESKFAIESPCTTPALPTCPLGD
jgi:Flp pilus assembly protein TadG